MPPFKPDPSQIQESICDKARRLAREADEEYYASERKKVSAIIGGEAPERGEDGLYNICGHKWRFIPSRGLSGMRLDCCTEYKEILIYQNPYAYDPVTFGRSLIAADKQLALFKIQYPDTIWGNMKAWFCTLL